MRSELECRDVVRVRGRVWTVRAVTRFEGCSELDLASRTLPLRGPRETLTVLTPFDRPARVNAAGRLAVVSRRAWMRAFRAAVLQPGGAFTLRAAARAQLDLLPHQLEPAIEVVRRGAARLLLADGVGLGKTIQAGIIMAELRDRLELERGLILTPPGLRDQWADELGRRFALDATIADAAWLSAMRASWPSSLNPWSMPGIFIASIEFAKRAEVRRSLSDVPWDIVVIDEAHAASAESDRREAAHASASHARRVLLLTATPHAGDQAAFDALARIGALDATDRLTLFRRSRADVGLAGRRRIHLLRVRVSGAERAVHRALRDYVRAVWSRPDNPDGRDARLAMIVLVKRSLSGMAPLARSLDARLASLGAPAEPVERQLTLPWSDDLDAADEAPALVLHAPGLADPAEERRWLERLGRMAGGASAADSKRRALRRLLGRIGLPVIVFTEYRDTLASLQAGLGDLGPQAVLHGGLDRADRRRIVDRFTRGDVRVLLATDAAGVGLNLQERCRVVVNLELPWNPMRLEQRIGRVDRIGQTGTVHAINLLARETAESVVLARLARRLDRASTAVRGIEGVLGWSDTSVAARWIGLDDGNDAGSTLVGEPHEPKPRRAGPAPVVERPDCRAEAAEMIGGLEQLRALGEAARQQAARTRPDSKRAPAVDDVAVACVTGRRLPTPLRDGGVLAVARVDGEIVPVFVRCRVPQFRRAIDLRATADAFLRAHTADVLAAAHAQRSPRALSCGRTPAAHNSAQEARGSGGRARETARANGETARAKGETAQATRDSALARLSLAKAGPSQPGLFDRRTLRAAAGQWRARGTGQVRLLQDTEPQISLLLFITAGARRP